MLYDNESQPKMAQMIGIIYMIIYVIRYIKTRAMFIRKEAKIAG